MVKLQLALDTLDGDEALKLASIAAPFVNILEAGTPLIKSVGFSIVTRLKAAHPDKLILADLKSSDVGGYGAEMAFKAGADIVTTQGITTLATIREVQREADKWKRRAEVDMTGVDDPTARSKQVLELGVGLVLPSPSSRATRSRSGACRSPTTARASTATRSPSTPPTAAP